jgi:hypothetical protein
MPIDRKDKNWGDAAPDEIEDSAIQAATSASDEPAKPEATIIHYMEDNRLVYLNMKGQRTDVSHKQFDEMRLKGEIYLHRDHIWKHHWRFAKK